MSVALGAKDEDTLTSLANRIIRLNSQMNKAEKKIFEEKVTIPADKLAANLLNAFDEEILQEKAQTQFSVDSPTEEQIAAVQTIEIKAAVQPLMNPEARDCIENIRRSHEQIIDNVNLDSVIKAGFTPQLADNAGRTIQTFREFIEENKDELLALRIIYSQPYKDRPMVIEKLKELYEKLTSKGITAERLWDCYSIVKPERVKRGTMAQLTDLISFVRFELGYADKLEPFADRVNYNFMQWTLKRNAGAVHFSEEQMEWLRLIKEHIISSLSIVPDDFDYTPFDHKGGLGRFYQVFGEQYEAILNEMNEVLVA